jgi:phosphoribosylaminoimidazole-succinocarboxamide synthase
LPPELLGRSMLVRKAERVDVECIARGYLAGSAWAEYRQTGRVLGHDLPPGLRESEALPEPIFTPTTKAESGHDLPMSNRDLIDLVGLQAATVLRLRTLAIYRYAAEYARSRGIIIADTKLEFGYIDGELSIIDELLTPDSSRFWPLEGYEPGRSQPSYDKQYVRDWLMASGWNKEPPAPELPPEVVERTAEKYREAFRLLTGRELWRPADQ